MGVVNKYLKIIGVIAFVLYWLANILMLYVFRRRYDSEIVSSSGFFSLEEKLFYMMGLGVSLAFLCFLMCRKFVLVNSFFLILYLIFFLGILGDFY